MTPDIPAAGSAPLANIGARERRKRLVVGVMGLVTSIAMAAVLLAGDAPRVWRLALFLPLVLSALGLLQARAQTCVALAARACRNLDHGTERITDAETLRLIQARARRITVTSVLLAAAGVALLLLLP